MEIRKQARTKSIMNIAYEPISKKRKVGKRTDRYHNHLAVLIKQNAETSVQTLRPWSWPGRVSAENIEPSTHITVSQSQEDTSGMRKKKGSLSRCCFLFPHSPSQSDDISIIELQLQSFGNFDFNNIIIYNSKIYPRTHFSILK